MIYQADAVLKSCVEFMIEDMKANPWLLDDIFSNFTTNVYLKKKYATQIQNVKDWFANNNIHVELGYVSDGPEYPRISIVLGNQTESEPMKTMGDASVDTVMLLPNQIGKPIPFIVKPFTPTSVDPVSGNIEVPANLKGYSKAVPGQIIVNTSTGKGTPILEIMDDIIMIESGLDIGSGTLAILPKYQYYEAKVEHTWMNANYKVICTGGSDVQQAIWLHDICLYGLFRYREGLLEALGLTESMINSEPLVQNSDMTDGGQVAWERTISISGKIEQTFIKAPHRLLETAEFVDTNPNNACPAPDMSGWASGIRILSNLDATPEQIKEDLWSAEEDEE